MTRCDQATPEPDSPFKAVILHGGRGLGFSQIMPAFGDLLSDDQIDDVIGYLHTFYKNDRRLCVEAAIPSIPIPIVAGGAKLPRLLEQMHAWSGSTAILEA